MSNGKPTAQQIAFAKYYAETQDAVESYKLAYPDNAKKVKYLKSTAYHKLSDPKIKSLIEEIQQGIRAQFVLLSPEALDNIINLANNAESEKVRLEANREILWGAGLKPPEQVELKAIGIFGSASVEDIRDMIRAQLEEPEPEQEKVNDGSV
jgi:hypothetical protein